MAVDLGGRPFIFTDAEKLRESLEAYFSETKEEEWTITGLAMHLDCDRDTLLNYEKHSEERKAKGIDKEVIRLIKKAKMIVHNAYERDLRKKGRSGDIFALKNFGWKDQRDLDHTSGGQPFTMNILVHGNNVDTDDETSPSMELPDGQEYE